MRNVLTTLTVMFTFSTLVYGGSAAPEQLDYSAFARSHFTWVDPNALVGCVLAWNPGDPNVLSTWQTTAGKQTRTAKIYDNEGGFDNMAIRGVANSVPILGTIDPNAGTWTIEADIPIGQHLITLCIDDPGPDPANMATRHRWLTIPVEAIGPENTTPVVE